MMNAKLRWSDIIFIPYTFTEKVNMIACVCVFVKTCLYDIIQLIFPYEIDMWYVIWKFNETMIF